MIESNKTLKSLIQKMLEFPIGFPWEVQGLGFMRLYLGDRSQRLHIWDSSLKVYQASALHTHPWDIHSTVIAGVYKQHRYLEYMDHAHAVSCGFPGSKLFNKAFIETGAEAKVKDQKEVFLFECELEVVHAGFDYDQKKEEIHYSLPEDGTVTIIDRTLYPEPAGHGEAYSYWRGKGPWVSAAPRMATKEEVLRVTQTALDNWF